MVYIITQNCCNDASCVPVCPVDCIRPRPDDPDFMTAEQLYIDPVSCIECSACMFECPVGAIQDEYDMTPGAEQYLAINADYFADNPLDVSEAPPETKRHAIPSDRGPLRVAVIGSGPSGCYAIEELASVAGVEVSVYDRLPTPFGLLRSGVAPDHAKTKQVSDRFQAALKRPNVTCHFNVEIGRDVTIENLLASHHAVIYAAGANSDNKLGIPGEALSGSHSAREFVSWYNGHPDFAERKFDLSSDRAILIGNGNVALDVARALTRPVSVFESTDMSIRAIEALRSSSVREVVIVARRGPEFAACSMPELLALSQLDEIDVVAHLDEVQGMDCDDAGVDTNTRRKRQTLRDLANTTPGDKPRIVFRFDLTPVEAHGNDGVQAVTFRRTSDPDGPTETLEAGLLLRAVGYRTDPVPGLPHDDRRGVIPNSAGCVTSIDGQPMVGMYVVGWAKRGATGVIGTNNACSKETVAALIGDFNAGRLPNPTVAIEEPTGAGEGQAVQRVDLDGWKRIDAEEKRLGKEAGVSRQRLKMLSVDEMLHVARQQGNPS